MGVFLRTCVIRPSHAAWGFGVYLTDIAPLPANRQQVSLVFGRRRFYAERLEAYVRIDREKADAERHPDVPRVFIASGKVSIAGAPVEIGLWQGGDEPHSRTCSHNIDKILS